MINSQALLKELKKHIRENKTIVIKETWSSPNGKQSRLKLATHEKYYYIIPEEIEPERLDLGELAEREHERQNRAETKARRKRLAKAGINYKDIEKGIKRIKNDYDD